MLVIIYAKDTGHRHHLSEVVAYNDEKLSCRISAQSNEKYLRKMAQIDGDKYDVDVRIAYM